MNKLKRHNIVNLPQYDVLLTTSFETKHGISGHLFEMIEYFYHLFFHKKITTGILISDGLTKDEFLIAITDKYNFTNNELDIIMNNTYFFFQPRLIRANTLLIVNGSFRMKDCTLIVKNKILFRCNETKDLETADIVLQDYDVYEPLTNSVHYKKKILFERFNTNYINQSNNKAMFYATTNSRKMTFDEIKNIIKQYSFDSYIVLSNQTIDIPDNCELKIVPIKNLWGSFDTYIYTNASSLTDCSPRFVAECEFFNKDIIFHTNDKIDKGLETRLYDMKYGNIYLKENDDLYSKIKHLWN